MQADDDNTPLSAQGFSPSNAATPGERPLEASGFEPLNPQQRPPRRLAWPWVGAGVATLALLLCLFFLLTARSLEVVVNAEGDATVEIDAFTVSVGGRYLIRPGRYPLTVTVPGYDTWEGEVTVTNEDSQRLDVSPAIQPGRVSIRTTPHDAQLWLDEEPLGTAPLDDRTLPAGEHRLRVSAPRYQESAQTIDITGRGTAQMFEVALAPNWADIALPSEPPAEVYVDDELIGDNTEPLAILAGEHRVVLRRAGYRDHERTLSVTAGEPQRFPLVQLLPADGVLTLRSEPAGASVTVDGEFRGRTPLEVELTPNQDHTVQLSKLGYGRKTLAIALAKGATEERSITLTPQLGDVTLTLEPADAEWVIDGTVVGSGSRTLQLPAFEHRLEVRKPGYASERRRFTPRPGLEQLIEIRLLTEAEARKAALQPEITNALGQTLMLIDPISEPMNEFVMGASRREPGRRSNEVEHTVRLERAFYIATTETTNAQFRLFLAGHNSGQIEGNSLNREHQPVTQVSWQQAARFCNWLSAKEGLPLFYRETQGIVNGYNPSSTGYRLPTEAEWAFAARVEGSAYRRFAWGDVFPPQSPVVNVADNTSALVTGRILNGYADGHIVSAPVASFPANHRGLYDMGGNVAEWVHDVYSIPSANAEVSTDPLGARSGDNYTVRGASWGHSRLSELRLTFRDYGAAGRDDLGFRIARYAE